MAKISEMPPDAAAAELYRQYLSAHRAWEGDHSVKHPSFDTKAWRQAAHDAGTLIPAQDGMTPAEYLEASATGGVAGKVAGTDNPPPTPGSPRAPVAATDGRYVVSLDGRPRFEHADGIVTTDGAALVARASQSNPERVRRQSAVIKGYKRLP
jgi:hypothetical protein